MHTAPDPFTRWSAAYLADVPCVLVDACRKAWDDNIDKGLAVAEAAATKVLMEDCGDE